MSNFNEYCNWCDSEETLEKYFNDIARHVSWKMFENQEDWIYMIGELGEGRNPMIKSKEKFEEAFDRAYDEYTSTMRAVMYYGFLQEYKDNDIDLPEDLEWDLKDWNGEIETYDEDEDVDE